MTTANGESTAADVDAILDALFQGPRERFVAERNAAARRLAAQGHKPQAARIKGLAKPSVSAWAVNRLWWAHRPAMQTLLEAARRQAGALRSGAGPAQQAAAGQARRRALDALLELATEELGRAGSAAGAGTLRKICTTLDALASHTLVPGGPTPGRLTTDLDPPGFDLLHALDAHAPDAHAPDAHAPDAHAPAVPAPAARARARADAEAELETITRRRDAARQRAQQAAQALDEATTRADAALLTAQAAAERLDEARARADAARQAAEQAERESLRLDTQARREQERAYEARRSLEGLTRELHGHDQAVQRARERLMAQRER